MSSSPTATAPPLLDDPADLTALRSRGGDPDELLAVTRTKTARSRPAAEALVDWFLEHTGAARDGR